MVRRRAAAALGSRGGSEAMPVLLDMIVEGANDVEAADALAVLARDPATADRIAEQLADLLSGNVADAAAQRFSAGGAADPAARRRLTQALAEIPGDVASKALADVRDDDDRAVALTAAYLLSVRGQIGGRAGPGS